MTLFLPFQNGERVTFTAETVAQRNGTVAAKEALITCSAYRRRPGVRFLSSFCSWSLTVVSCFDTGWGERYVPWLYLGIAVGWL